MVKAFGLTHIALAVCDAERAFRFYAEVFGVVEVYRDTGFIQAQTPGSRDGLVFEARRRPAKGSGGLAHFGFRLVDPADIDAAADAVVRAGGKITGRGEFCPGEPYVSFTDPDGYEVEIWHELPTAVDPPTNDRSLPRVRS